jgi:hypothetical protein
MSATSNENKLCIVKQLLLSSPPGQFQQTLLNLQTIFDDDNENSSSTSAQLITREFIQEVQSIYNSNTGRQVLSGKESSDSNDKSNVEDDDQFGNSLKESFQNYIKKYYSSKGVESNYVITVSSNENNSNRYDIILYAERIKLKQFHAGSWMAKYTVDYSTSPSSSTVINGLIQLHAHAFEDGNVQVKSKTELPSHTIENTTSLSEDIMAQIQKWEEEYVLQPLKDVYHDMSNDILKKMRRVMPVTRTKFDWNVEGNHFIKTMGMDVQNK